MKIIRSIVVSLALVSGAAVGCSGEDPGAAAEDINQSIAFEELDLEKQNAPEGLTVLTNAQSFVDFFGQAPPASVSFKKHWVVHLSAGMMGTGGYDIEIARIGKSMWCTSCTGPSSLELVVYGIETSPGPDCAVTKAPTNPQITVRINKQPNTPYSRLDLARETSSCASCCDPASKPPAFEPTQCCLGPDGPAWQATGSAHPCNDLEQPEAPACEAVACCDQAARPPAHEPTQCCLGPDGPAWQATGSAHPCNDLQQATASVCCDPTLICAQVISCVEGKQYPTGCGPANCNEPIGDC